jgi:ATP-dependent Lhr-like helicase
MKVNFNQTKGYRVILDWLEKRGRKPFPFQEEAWQYILQGKSGLLMRLPDAERTYSIFLGSVIQFIKKTPKTGKIKIITACN